LQYIRAALNKIEFKNVIFFILKNYLINECMDNLNKLLLYLNEWIIYEINKFQRHELIIFLTINFLTVYS